MKKKHRDITVYGEKYGWTVRGGEGYAKTLCIWKDKKIIKEIRIASHYSITPKLVADCIKEPDNVDKLGLEAESCPFCMGDVREHPKQAWQNSFFVCYHSKNCWMIDDVDFEYTLIPKNKITLWNNRY